MMKAHIGWTGVWLIALGSLSGLEAQEAVDRIPTDGLERALARTADQLQLFGKAKRRELTALPETRRYTGFPDGGGRIDAARECDAFLRRVGETVLAAEKARKEWKAGRRSESLYRYALSFSAMRLYQALWDIRILETSILIWHEVVRPHRERIRRLQAEYDAAANPLEKDYVDHRLSWARFREAMKCLYLRFRSREVRLQEKYAGRYREMMEAPRSGKHDVDVRWIGRHRELAPLGSKVGFFQVEREIEKRMIRFLELAKADGHSRDRLAWLTTLIREIKKTTEVRALGSYGFGYLALAWMKYRWSDCYRALPIAAPPDYRRR